MKLDPQTVRALLDAFAQSEWRELTVSVGDDRVRVAGAGEAERGIATVRPATAAAAAGAEDAPPPILAEQLHAAASPPTGTVVESPSVGLFWRSPSPGAPPFVEVGSRVAVGETMAIVEVMKLMNQLVSPVAGAVNAILVENGAQVQFGQPLLVVDPEA